MTPREVQQIADAHGIALRRPGHPGLPEADRLGARVTVRFTAAEYAAIAAAAIDAGTTPPAWLRAVGAAAAEGQTLRAAAEQARITSAEAEIERLRAAADRLAVAPLIASGDMDAAEELGPHPTAAEVEQAVGVVNLTTENCHPLDGFDGW
jgi:hypothetical protein